MSAQARSIPEAGDGPGSHLIQRPGRGRASRIVVCGPGAGAAGLAVARSLGQAGRNILLDTAGTGAPHRPGLSDVLAGRARLAAAIRPGRFCDRLGRGPGHPDRLIDDPHALAVIIDALAFSYGAVLMLVPLPRTSIIGEVLAAVSDQVLLAPGPGRGWPRPADVALYRRHGTARVALVDRKGRAADCPDAGILALLH